MREEEGQPYKFRISMGVFIGTLIFVCGLVLIMLLVWVIASRLYTLSQLRYLNANLAYDVAQMLDIQLGSGKASLDFLAQDLANVNLFESNSRFRSFLAAHSDFREFWYFDKNFNSLLHLTQPDFLPRWDIDVFKERVFQTFQDKEHLGGIYWGANNELLLLMVRQMPNGNILAAHARLDAFLDKAIQLPSAMASQLYILDRDGSLLAHTDKSILARRSSYADYRFFKEAPAAKTIGLVRDKGTSEELSLIASYRYKPLDWVIAMETPEKFVFLWIFKPVFWNIILLLLIIPYAFWVSSYIYRVLHDKTSQFKEAFGKIKGGQWYYRLIPKRYEELAESTEAFNQMAETVEQKVLALEAEKEFLKSSERFKSKLIEIVNRRLFVPLTTMKFDLEVVLGGQLGRLTKAAEIFLRLIHRKNSNIISTIEDILLVEEIESNRFVIKKELSNLEVLTEIVCEELRGLRQSKRLKLDIAKNVDVMPDFEVDNFKIKKVIFKLLSNAIKFSREEGTISIHLEAQAEEIIFSIQDRGAGMGKADQSRVFSKFFRAGNISLTHPEASGLSLYIAQQIIERHGGRIWFTSEAGEGSTFYFSLPI
ncbi:MAG: sensor histidine kinase [Parcubacteria group bacterium]|nr:sensor histidine kinase [Parcubacteria group bacterium]